MALIRAAREARTVRAPPCLRGQELNLKKNKPSVAGAYCEPTGM
jgi:hypothetical protein